MQIINGDNTVLDFKDEYPSIDVKHEFLQGDKKNPNITNRRKYSSQWTGSDTEKRYDENIAKGIKHTYKKDDFYYDINANGFRCDNFDTMDFTKKSIIYLGCSKTYGIGVPESDAWPTMFHEMIQKERNTTYNYVNLGVPGGGIDYYLHFLPYFSKFNPALIISATPEIVRMNLIKDERSSEEIAKDEGCVHLRQYIVNDVLEDGWNKTLSPTANIYKGMISYGDAYFEYRKRVVFASIDSFAKMLNARFVENGTEDILRRWKEVVFCESEDYLIKANKNARDLAHPSISSHKHFTEMMMDKIKGNNYEISR